MTYYWVLIYTISNTFEICIEFYSIRILYYPTIRTLPDGARCDFLSIYYVLVILSPDTALLV